VYWTHNDSGDGPFVYAFNEKGENLGTFRVSNAQNNDWEDMAEYKDPSGKCFLYIGDVGDNNTRRPERTIFRLAEPAVSESTYNTISRSPILTEPASFLNFRYPGVPRNAETIMVDPQSGSVYVLTKSIEKPSEVFKIVGEFGSSEPVLAQKVGDVAVPNVPNGQLTGGDISPDGKHVVICDYSFGYEMELPVGAKSFDEIWGVKPDRFDIGKIPQAEAIGYTADGSAVLLTSEKERPPIVKVQRTQ
jgi:hypothetical protein